MVGKKEQKTGGKKESEKGNETEEGPRVWCTCAKVNSVMPSSLRPTGLKPDRLFCPWNFPGKNTGKGCHALLQWDLPDPGIEPTSLMSPAFADKFFTTGATWEAQ